MGYDVHTEKGFVNRGNLHRMKKLMRLARQGDRMTLAFLGGSITQGSVSSQYTNCYAYLVYDWFVRRFPKTAFTYVNAGVGGTTSQFGVSRVEEDVLAFKPDFVIIEFSVNDDNTDFYQETYEGLCGRCTEINLRLRFFWYIIFFMTAASVQRKSIEKSGRTISSRASA